MSENEVSDVLDVENSAIHSPDDKQSQMQPTEEKSQSQDESDLDYTRSNDLAERAAKVLIDNHRGIYTSPDNSLYPHQWLWDSCFIAIGLRHLDVDKAQTELASLIRGQWANGMLPNIIFNTGSKYRTDRNYWRSWINPNSPDELATSGITQPPVLAEAVWQVGQSLKPAERRSWFKFMLPHIVRYHEWLYADRDPHKEGLVLLVHPWETGLDNTPPWMHSLHQHLIPVWIRIIQKYRLEGIVNLFRRDHKSIPAEQRFTTIEILTLFSAQRRLRRKGYDTAKILKRGLFSIEDVSFNSIFIRNNTVLKDIAKYIRKTLPDDLLSSMEKTEKALDKLWDPYAKAYWSREFVTHETLKQPSIATLMPLYAGTISKERAAELVSQIENANVFGPRFPVPSVPVSSPKFDPVRYWQGPSWVNTNWLLIDGLRRYGYHDHADALTESTIEMVDRSGFYEYFNPRDGAPLGAKDFSWTAALTLDLLQAEKNQ